MKIMHTADLHLGCSLKNEKRFHEHEALLDHFCNIIREEQISAVIIAGDVFDTHLPPNRAAELYYRFLVDAEKAGAEKIIVIGGNHDSAAYLEAPAHLLKHLSVHVFASAEGEFSDMVLPLRDKNGKLAALVGCLPYLHEKDMELPEYGHGILERENALRSGVVDAFKRMADTLNAMDTSVPHIVTGHLFATDKGGKDDSWTGTLMSIDTSLMPGSIDYLALGHLHDAHTLSSPHKTIVRYPGAPLNVSFRELDVPKSVTVIDTEDIRNPVEIPLPVFQEMHRLEGPREELELRLAELAASGRSVWCSVENTGSYEAGLSENLNAIVADSPVKILTCSSSVPNPAVVARLPEERRLADIAPAEVFKLMLKEYNISGDAADTLLAAFNEIETAARED